jgi:metal-responsive CopG/Arc/MetJ family transcriptional regulator
MRRVNVLLSDKLLDEIDKEAKREGISRSALIRAALERYIEANRCERDHEEEQNKMHEAARKMDQLAEKLGEWDPYVTIKKFRDTNFNSDF